MFTVSSIHAGIASTKRSLYTPFSVPRTTREQEEEWPKSLA